MSAAVSPSRLGFCQRCGDPTNKFRCSRCGGTSKEPRIRSTAALPAAKKADPWAHRYVNGQSSFPSTHAREEKEEDEEYLHNQPPPLSPKRASYDPAIGFGMPSRISRDLRTSLKPDSTNNSLSLGLLATSPNGRSVSPSRLSPAPTDNGRRLSNDYSAPLVKGSDGVLSKVCGSLVEPSSTRNRWACADCNSVFARDSTLYAAPQSLQGQDSSYYCKECYAKRYSLGPCLGCKRAVLGSTKEDGKYVKAAAGIWHGKCWKCSFCEKAQGVLVGMDGRPVCEGCFDRPKRNASPLPPSVSKEELGLPDVRRLTRVGAGRRGGAMGATIAELTKKLGQTTVSSPKLPYSTSGSNTSLPRSSSSQSSLQQPGSPSKSQLTFPNHAMVRSGSLTGSPPKPRPLTARFREGMELGAFRPSFAGEDERVVRRDSRSRSISPAKRPTASAPFAKTMEKKETSPSSSLEADKVKVPGSPSLIPPTPPFANDLPVANNEDGRRRTSSGFPRPLNPPFSKNGPTEPLQGEKSTEKSESSALEPVEGSVRCAACHLLPFERCSEKEKEEEVMMVTLANDVHLHADCFRCSVCQGVIDGAKTFVRLQAESGYAALGEALAAYAHPQCSPAIQVRVVQERREEKAEMGGQRSFRASLDPASTREGGNRSHATHQRELKPSPTPSPATSMRDRTGSGARPSILPSDPMAESSVAMVPTASNTASNSGGTAFRRFQPTAGAAPPTRSTILSHPHPSSSSSSSSTSTPARAANPAAGIFTRLNALSSASGNPSLTTTSTSTKGRVLGGMQTCAFCGEKLSSLESVLGPRGTQWHKSCLICRAPPPKREKEVYGWRKQEPTICGKKLDSGAKVNREGEVRCRDCYDRECSAFRIKN